MNVKWLCEVIHSIIFLQHSFKEDWFIWAFSFCFFYCRYSREAYVELIHHIRESIPGTFKKRILLGMLLYQWPPVFLVGYRQHLWKYMVSPSTLLLLFFISLFLSQFMANLWANSFDHTFKIYPEPGHISPSPLFLPWSKPPSSLVELLYWSPNSSLFSLNSRQVVVLSGSQWLSFLCSELLLSFPANSG